MADRFLKDAVRRNHDAMLECGAFLALISGDYLEHPICLLQLALAVVLDKPIVLVLQRGPGVAGPGRSGRRHRLRRRPRRRRLRQRLRLRSGHGRSWCAPALGAAGAGGITGGRSGRPLTDRVDRRELESLARLPPRDLRPLLGRAPARQPDAPALRRALVSRVPGPAGRGADRPPEAGRLPVAPGRPACAPTSASGAGSGAGPGPGCGAGAGDTPDASESCQGWQGPAGRWRRGGGGGAAMSRWLSLRDLPKRPEGECRWGQDPLPL